MPSACTALGSRCSITVRLMRFWAATKPAGRRLVSRRRHLTLSWRSPSGARPRNGRALKGSVLVGAERRGLSPAGRAGRRGVRGRRRPRVSDGCRSRRPDPDDHALHAGGVQRHRTQRDPQLHRSQQPVDRHRRPSRRARHLRQFLSGPADRPGRGDDRARSAAIAHDLRRDVEGRRADRGHHRQGQAAQAARQGPGRGRRPRLLLLPARRPLHRRRARHRRCARLRRAAASGHVLARAVAVRAGRRDQVPRGRRSSAAALPDADRLRAAHLRAGSPAGAGVLSRPGPASWRGWSSSARPSP